MEVVRKTFLPQIMGDEWPRPGISAFHRTFLDSLHSIGRFFSLDMPLAPGPLHCGQFASSSTRANDRKAERGNKQSIKMTVKTDVSRLNNPDVIRSKESLRIDVIWDKQYALVITPTSESV